jgi:hypothetical protein
MLFLIVLWLLPACRDHSTGPEPLPSIQLDVDYRGTDFVWLRLSAEETVKDLHYLIRRNNEDRFTGQFSGRDTLITDTSLTPGTEYYYTVYGLKKGEPVDSGDTVPVTTLPLSSHDFHWEIDTLGEYGSMLRDVFAFSENDVWVVGEIITNVHTGERANAAHWDGSKWELHKIDLNPPMYYILGFSQDDLWMVSGIPHHWDGINWSKYHLWDMGVLSPNDGILTKIWGTSSSNLYFVGGKGTIVHYDGSQYRRMESGTDAALKDIDGIYDPETGQTRIWVAGTGVLLYSEGETWEVIWDFDHPFFKDNYKNPTAIYIPDNKSIIIATWNGSKTKVTLHRQESFNIYHTLVNNDDIYILSMSGNNMNDFFMAGTYTEVAHYNGLMIHSFSELKDYGILWNCIQKDNHSYVVGYQGGGFARAVIFRGIR